MSAFESLAAVVASDDVTLITDGGGHGWELLNDPGDVPGTTIGDQLAAFIRG